MEIKSQTRIAKTIVLPFQCIPAWADTTFLELIKPYSTN